jgi:hypothetical protein
MNRHRHERELPLWFTAPVAHGGQMSLFKMSTGRWLADIGVSHDQLKRWHKLGWIDAPNMPADLPEHDPRQWRVELVADLARSGLSDHQISSLLCGLPSESDPDRLAYSFRYGWVLPACEHDLELHDIEEWIASADHEELLELKAAIEDRLSADLDAGP